MVNESDEDEDEVEDDSETGAMLRSSGPTSERTGKKEICYFMCFHRIKGHTLLIDKVFSYHCFRRRIYSDVWWAQKE